MPRTSLVGYYLQELRDRVHRQRLPLPLSVFDRPPVHIEVFPSLLHAMRRGFHPYETCGFVLLVRRWNGDNNPAVPWLYALVY